MSVMTNFLQDAALNFLFRGVDYTKPTQTWLSFASSVPDKDGSPSNELTALARLEINFPDATAAQNITIANTDADFQFDTTGTGFSSQTISHALIWDAETAGNLLCWIPLDSSLTVTDPEPIEVVTGAIEITFNDDPSGSPANWHLSNYSRATWLTQVFGTTNLSSSRPTAWTVALFHGDPSSDGSTNEFTGGSYARQAVAWAAPTAGPTGVFRMVTNVDIEEWLNLQQSPIDYWGCFESAPGANFLARSDQANSALSVGDNAQAAAGELKIAVS